MMEAPKERPSKTKKKTEPPRTSGPVDSQRMQLLVKRLENLEVPEGEFSEEPTVQSIRLDESVIAAEDAEESKPTETTTTTTAIEQSMVLVNGATTEDDGQSRYQSFEPVIESGDVVETPLSGLATDDIVDDAIGAQLTPNETTFEEIQPEETPDSSELLSVSIIDNAAAKEDEKIEAPEAVPAAVAEVESNVQLYPEINRLRLQELETEAQTVQEPKSRMRVKESAPPMALALEPLTEMQLRSFYYNAELERVDDFVDEFLETTIRPTSGDEFFMLLQSYLESCRRVEQLNMDAQDLNQRWDSARRNVWLTENVVLKEQGHCGEGRLAAGTYTIQRTKFQQPCFEEVKNLAQKRRNLRVVQLAFAAHQSKTAELQCKHYICSALQNYRTATGISAFSPSFIRFDEPPQSLIPARRKILNCITVLFHFLRQPAVETVFNQSCRSWLNDLCGNLLRYSFVDDHLFLLSHVLRCPNGVGVWAAGYIQPVCHLNSSVDGERAVDHFLSMLSICLNPIRRREDYLKSFVSPDVINSWTIVDADGEEERELVAISEADLLSLLNQFSFDQLFSTWFEQLQQSQLTEGKILRLFAFELTILRILFDGIRSYNGLQYKQICKQLAYVMRQSVQYVAEFWLYFKSQQSDPVLCERLQLEFDRLVLYTVFYGVSSKGLGVWQFLADLPYGDISLEFQWRIIDLLLSPSSNGISPRDLFDKSTAAIQEEMKDPKVLELRLHDLDQMDATYLLTALSNMAGSAEDVVLVQALTTILYAACFERPSTREVHHKAGRELIGAVVERHTWLLSYLLGLIESQLDRLGGYALELFDHVPVCLWSLTEADWTILSRWLFQPLASLPNTLAQRILLNFNWGYIDQSKRMFMTAFVHRQVAEAVVKAYDELCPMQAGLISGSIKKASKMASSVSGQLPAEQQFMDFCWQLLLRLILHPFDHDISDNVEPDGADADACLDLMERAEKGNPFAAFVAFQLTVRSAESFIQNGLGLLERLLNNYFVKAAVVCVTYGVRLLVNAESLQNDEKWYRCFDSLVHVDDTYYQLAKTLVTGNFIGENLTNFAAVLSDAVLSLTTKRQQEASKFVNYALRLCCYSNQKPWNSDRSTLYLLDRLIEASFLNDPSLKDVVEVLRSAYETVILAQHRGTKGGMLSLFRSEKPPPPLLASSHFGEFPWLAFCAIKCEETTFQQFYRNFFSEMMRHPSQSLEHCVKSASAKSNTHFTIDRLAPYLYLELGCSIDAEHPLLPLVCQECCLILFQRMRLTEDPSLPPTCMGGRYLRNDAFLAKYMGLKKVVQSALSPPKSDADDQQGVSARIELFKAVHAWLSDSRLFLQYQSDLAVGLPMPYVLDGTLNGNRTPWLEYVDFAAIRSSVEKRAKGWTKCRLGDSGDVGQRPQRRPIPVSALQRLFDRLKNTDRHGLVPPPAATSVDPVFFTPDANALQDDGQIFGIVDSLLSNFYAAANDFADMQKSVLSLDELFFEQLKKLYQDISVQVTVTLKCHRSCASPNNTKIMAKSSKLLDNVQNSLDQNRVAWSDTIDNISALVAYNIPHHCVCLYAIVRQLIRVYIEEQLPEEASARLQITGVGLFYKFVSVYSDRIAEFPPTKALFQATIDHLGMTFILRNQHEIENLFHLFKEKQPLFSLLINFFDTDCASKEAFFRMYESLCDWIKCEALPVDSLVECLKKVKVRNALERFNNAEITRLYHLILTGCSAAATETQTPILTVLRSHSVDTFTAGLPSNFRSSLEALLKASESGAVTSILLSDVLAALKTVHASGGAHLGPAVYVEIVSFLSDYFKTTKSKCKECMNYGIYHCWEKYAADLWPLLAFCFVHSLLNPEAYPTPGEGLRKSFSTLTSLFGPWIEPSGTSNEACSPWSLNVAATAEAFVQSYVDCLCYIQRLYGGENEPMTSICALALEWYVGKLGPRLDKLGLYVLRSYHAHLIRLPWNTFQPTITTMEAMRQMVSKDSPSSSFITSVIVRLPWAAVFRSVSTMPKLAITAISNLLLSIVVRCAGKESNYADCKASYPELLQSLASFDWSCLEPSAVEGECGHIMLTFDPKSILRADDPRSVEGGVLRLLANACYFSNTPPSTATDEMRDSITQKRIRFIRLLVAMAVRCTRFPDVPSSAVTQFFAGLIGRINSLLVLKFDARDQRSCAVQLLSEAALFLNQANHQLFDESLETINHWLMEHPNSVVCLSLIEAYGRVGANAATWLAVSEKCIAAHFMRHTPAPTWSEVNDHFCYKETWTTSLKSDGQQKAFFLSLYAFWTKRLQQRRELPEETLILREVVETVKLIGERQCHEAPSPVVIGLAVHLLVRQLQFGAKAASVVALTRDLSSALQNAAEGKTGILSSLGLSKRINYSSRFQLLCTAISNYLLQQIIDDGNIRSKTASVITNSRMQWAKNLRTQKQYASLNGAVDLVNSFISDSYMHFEHAITLYAKLTPMLFSERYILDQCSSYARM